jgi:MarR family transcriptional regulator for hemolysin
MKTISRRDRMSFESPKPAEDQAREQISRSIRDKPPVSADDIELLAEQPFRMCFLIHDVSRLRRAYIDKLLKPIGLTNSQCSVLVALSRQDDAGLAQSELAHAMGIGKTTLCGLIDRLELKGYVQRRSDPTDRRIKHITLTGLGRGHIETIREIVVGVNARILRIVSAADVARTEDVLFEMKRQLIELDSISKAPYWSTGNN